MIIPMLFAVVYLLSCFGVATAAKHRKVGSQRAFHIAVLFTPLAALAVVLLSAKKLETHLQFYRCKRCGYEYPKNILLARHVQKRVFTFLLMKLLSKKSY